MQTRPRKHPQYKSGVNRSGLCPLGGCEVEGIESKHVSMVQIDSGLAIFPHGLSLAVFHARALSLSLSRSLARSLAVSLSLVRSPARYTSLSPSLAPSLSLSLPLSRALSCALSVSNLFPRLSKSRGGEGKDATLHVVRRRVVRYRARWLICNQGQL